MSVDNQVVVSNKMLILGSEQWKIESIAGAKLVSRKKAVFVNWLKLNSRTTPNILAAAVCLFGGFGIAALGAAIGGTSGIVWNLFLLVAIAVFFAGFVFIWRTYKLSLPDVYSLQLTLQDAAGVQESLEAKYQWEDHMQALAIEQAVLQAVSSK